MWHFKWIINMIFIIFFIKAETETETEVPTTTTEPIRDKLVLRLTPNKEVVTIDEGESLEIKCTARGPQPELQTVFYKDQVNFFNLFHE